jgi:hypothetical protein
MERPTRIRQVGPITMAAEREPSAPSDRARFRRGRQALTLVLVTILGSCSPGPSGSGLPSPTNPRETQNALPNEPALEETAWAKVLEQIGPNGEVNLQTALQAFVVAFGPLPGVGSPGGAASEISSGSAVVRWVLRHWEELTKAQQLAFDAYFPSPSQPSHSGILTAGLLGSEPSIRLAALQQDLEKIRDAVKAKIVTHLKRDFNEPIAVVLVNFPDREYPTANAATVGVNSKGQKTDGEMASCRIYVYPRGQQKQGATQVSMMAHEVFHCFQASLRTLKEYGAMPSWVSEGEASWVGETIAGGSDESRTWWNWWLRRPDISLFRREHDAIGFFSHAASMGRSSADSLWGLLDPALEAAMDGGNDAAFDQLVGDRDIDIELMYQWGSRYLRQPQLGPAWDFTGPGITATGPLVQILTLSTSATVPPQTVPAHAALPLHLSLDADVVIIDGPALQGLVRLPGGIDQHLDQVVTKALCTVAGGCVCEPGTPRAGASFVQTKRGVAELGAAGDTKGGLLQFSGYSLKDFCHVEEEGLVDPCLLGKWESAPWTLAGFEMNAPGHPFADTLIGGAGVRASFTADGREILDFDRMTDLSVFNTDLNMMVTVRFGGSVEGKVSADSGQLHFIRQVASTLTITASVDVAGGTFHIYDHVPLSEVQLTGGSPVDLGDFSYVCRGKTLTMPISARAEAVSWTRMP